MPLLLDLVRHGASLPAGAGGDDARPLSPAGRKGLERLAHRLAGLGQRPDRFFASPLRRARESAEILIGQLAPGGQAETLEELLPHHDPAEVTDALAGRAPTGHVVLVGHQPLLGRLVAFLAKTPEPSFPPGGLVRIEFAGRPARAAGKVVLELGPEGPS